MQETDRGLTEESKFQIEFITALVLENIYIPALISLVQYIIPLKVKQEREAVI